MIRFLYPYQITAMTKPEFPGYRQNVEIIWASDDASAQYEAKLRIRSLPKYDPATMEIHRLESAPILSIY